MTAVRLLQIVAAAGLGVLLASIVWASLESHVGVGLVRVAQLRWGLATLVDVYAGAVAVAAWMRLCERRTWAWLLWVFALVGLGHAVSLFYILLRTGRARSLEEVFSPAARQA